MKSLRTLTRLTLPLAVACSTSALAIDFQPDTANWFPFNAKSDTADHALGLAYWSAQPAGTQGRITREKDRLLYAGQPVKLWGLNVEYADCMPPKDVADARAAFYARQGFNSVRQHKYNDGTGWAGFGTPESMVQFAPDALDRFDYFNAKLIEKGLFLNLSSNFGVRYGPADAARFEAHADFAKGDNPFGRNRRISTGHGAVFLSPGLQALHIEQLTKLLRHTNPYTGKTYAEDPGVAFVEIFNEDAILFPSTNGQLQKSPILRTYAAERFATWLKNKYKTESAWRAAWGDTVVSDVNALTNPHLKSLIGPKDLNGAVPPESFATGVVPWGQPWFYDSTARPTDDTAVLALRPRLLDAMEFLTGLQDAFYAKTVTAIRDTGYTGEIIGSNWQAGSMTGHFWNLRSDANVGLIDRHNYFGGVRSGLQAKDGWGPVNNATQLDRPGSGLLSSGLQQVADRPFMLSEWAVVQPNEWYAEGPAIIGAYGMGLQGWDASYIFATYQKGGFAPNLDAVKKFSIDTPPIMGLMPAIARMVRRRDIREADTLATRHVSLKNLTTGQFDFNDFIEQAHDLKSFDGDQIPSETLAAARTVVAFDQGGATKPFDFAQRQQRGGIAASTGQLFWSETKGAYNDHITINTPATQGFVGFAEAGDRHVAGGFSITPQPGFAVILLTAEAPDATLATDRSALLVAMARARNTGMTFSPDGKTLQTVGKGPILLEPVRATLDFGSLKVRSVEVLDHDGQPTGKTVPLTNNTLQLDTGRDQSPYYRIQLR